MKENIKKYKNFVKTKQVGNVFFAPWLPGKSDLGKEDKTLTKALYLNTGDKRNRDTARKK